MAKPRRQDPRLRWVMRKVVVQEFMSLDGVIQAPGARDEDPSNGFPYGGWTAPYTGGGEPRAREFMVTSMAPADLLLGRELTQASKVVKQADVVMLCHLLTDEIDAETTRRNYEYYEPVTVHGSSLSPATHAAVAAEIGLPVQAMEAFRLACAVDLADNMGNAARGLHLATMGGVWQAVVMGFAGVRRRGRRRPRDRCRRGGGAVRRCAGG